MAQDNIFYCDEIKSNLNHSNLMDLLQTKVVNTVENSPEPLNTTGFSRLSSKREELCRSISKNFKKVKTVRDVRNEYEKYIYETLKLDIENQTQILYANIKNNAFKHDTTIKLAKNILDSDSPICNTAWDMITNLNPNNFKYGKQFVIYNGKEIRIRGSLGGNKKIVYNYDLDMKKTKKICKRSKLSKKSLFSNSLYVQFKPGPLSKKKTLDISYQKFNIGHTEIINLPKIGLEVRPLYGATFEPQISNYLHEMREENGIITEKWAEFATSSLGNIINNKPVQCVSKKSVFMTKYNNNQNYLLMREFDEKNNNSPNNVVDIIGDNETIVKTVKLVLEEMVESVVISYIQDSLYCEEENLFIEDKIKKVNTNKDKSKRNMELERLDVTIIRLAENSSKNDQVKTCENSYCQLGCVCSSLQSGFIIKGHCGRLDCMFNCKCNFSNLNNSTIEIKTSKVVDGFMDLKNSLHSNLTKEEQKFHHTVLVTDDKSVLLKTDNEKCQKNLLEQKRKELQIRLPYTSFSNIQCLCMVHSLYKCFCKNRFIENCNMDKSSLNENGILRNKNLEKSQLLDITSKSEIPITVCKSIIDPNKSISQTLCTIDKNVLNKIAIISGQESLSADTKSYCARTKVYIRKELTKKFYEDRNKNILDMEKHDIQLHDRLIELINKNTSKTLSNENLKSSELNINLVSNNTPVQVEIAPKLNSNYKIAFEKSYFSLYNQSNLKTLLEVHYKQYKDSLKHGTYQNNLKPPVKGKFGLYPWEIILSRYKEKKNYFFVTKENPFRMFLTVNINNYLINKCIDVNDIRISDINKYPSTIRRLLTDEIELKDYFCILYGLPDCWEVIGCVSKLNDSQKNNDNESDEEDNFTDKFSTNSLKSSYSDPTECIMSNDAKNMFDDYDSNKFSKWFVMELEDDINEIKFFNKNCFVTGESILKCIDIARKLDKVVRMSVKMKSQDFKSLFSIYATPNPDIICLLIGPYFKTERLDVEIETKNHSITKKVKGMWLLNENGCDEKILKDPLAFLKKHNIECVMSESEHLGVVMKNDTSESESDDSKLEQTPPAEKKVRPIIIRKHNTFFIKGAKTKFFKPISNVNKTHISTEPSTSHSNNICTNKLLNDNINNGNNVSKQTTTNLVECYDLTTSINTASKCIPEINGNNNNIKNNTDLIIISDDEESENNDLHWRQVWIECVNIVNLGYIPARKNNKNQISFLFPMFKPTKFYQTVEALSKLSE